MDDNMDDILSELMVPESTPGAISDKTPLKRSSEPTSRHPRLQADESSHEGEEHELVPIMSKVQRCIDDR